MGNVRFVLNETLEEMGISGYRVAVEAKIRPNTIYDLLDNQKKTISLEQLAAIVDALNYLAKEQGIKANFDIMDVLEYQDK